MRYLLIFTMLLGSIGFAGYEESYFESMSVDPATWRWNSGSWLTDDGQWTFVTVVRGGDALVKYYQVYDEDSQEWDSVLFENWDTPVESNFFSDSWIYAYRNTPHSHIAAAIEADNGSMIVGELAAYGVDISSAYSDDDSDGVLNFSDPDFQYFADRSTGPTLPHVTDIDGSTIMSTVITSLAVVMGACVAGLFAFHLINVLRGRRLSPLYYLTQSFKK